MTWRSTSSFPDLQSGTLFASHKLPLKAYLAAIAIFRNAVKGKSALALSNGVCAIIQGFPVAVPYRRHGSLQLKT
jgi:hypothetical protein